MKTHKLPPARPPTRPPTHQTVSADGLCITLEKANGSTWHGLGFDE